LLLMVGVALGGGCAGGDDARLASSSIVLTPATSLVAAGDSVDVVAAYADVNNNAVVALDAAFVSSDPAIATIAMTADGHATVRGVKPGTATITATGRALSGDVAITVSAAALRKIDLAPTMPGVAAGTSVQLTATGTFSDASTADVSTMVTWRSSATTVATVSASGLALGVKAGSATITATSGKLTASVTLGVTAAVLRSIAVTPATPSLPVGVTQQMVATGTFSDGSKQDLTAQVTWASDTAASATVAAGGLVTAVQIGSAKISATKGAISGSTTATVVAAALVSIAVTPAAPTLPIGRAQQMTATGTFTDHSTQDLTATVAWTTSDATVATVSAGGLVTAIAVGAAGATITATQGAISGSTTVTVAAAVLDSITVAPATATVAVGGTQAYTATGHLSDASTVDLTATAAWATGDATIATIAATGVATAVAAGTTAVTATSAGVTGTAQITVTP
jgi:uncharacterized protein YjdB